MVKHVLNTLLVVAACIMAEYKRIKVGLCYFSLKVAWFCTHGERLNNAPPYKQIYALFKY